MGKWIKQQYEAWQVMRAAKILMGRNVARAMVVSRHDNNAMWHMAENLEGVAKRIRDGYESA